MNITDEQIAYIERNLKFYGVASNDLRDDMLDHICTYIENSNTDDFETAYKAAVDKFGGYQAMAGLQHETYLQVSVRKNLLRQKLINIFGFIALFVLITGGLFKYMHWPGASILLLVGIVLVLFSWLPLYFYHRYQEYYKKSISG